MKEYEDLFAYYTGLDRIGKDDFKISPSGIEKFFSDKTTWYRENLLGESKKFTGSTSTVLGTCVHAVAEVVANAKMSGVAHDSQKLSDAIEGYIASYEPDPEYDTEKIESLWYSMGEALVKDHVLSANTISTEEFIIHELLPGVHVGGTYDAITSTVPNDDLYAPQGQLTVRDYKTAASKPSSFSYAYKLQAFTYAYILSKMGINISTVELCFVTQPTKTLPVRTFKFEVDYNAQAADFIEGILNLMAESVQTFKDYEDLQYLLACDYRLKKNDIPRPE